MVTFLVTSVLVLGLIAIAIYFWQKPANTTEPIELPPPPAVGLFSNVEPEQLPEHEPEQITGAPDARLLTEAELDQQTESSEFQARKRVAQEFIASWQESPDRNSTAKMLHLAALADDAETYGQAVETALNVWQRGSIPDMSAEDLQTLVNSEFWLLSSYTRSSGAGFVLKQTLSRAKRELERAKQPNLTHQLPPAD